MNEFGGNFEVLTQIIETVRPLPYMNALDVVFFSK